MTIPAFPDLQSLARALGGDVSGGQVLAPGPGHSPADRSLSVKLDAGAPGGFVVNSFADDDPIACKDYVRSKAGITSFEPNGNGKRKPTFDIGKMLAAQSAGGKPKGNIVATYNYTDTKDALLYQVVRFDPKDFRQRRPNGNGGWIWNLDDTPRVLYRLPELLQYPDATVFVAEGEKDADRVALLGHCATTVAGGKWTDECVKALAGRDCFILEDNDEAGRKKAQEAATALHGTAKSVRVIRLPDLPDKGDVSDWLDADQRNAEKLVDICFGAPPWSPTKAAAAATNSKTDAEIVLTFDRMADIEPKAVDWLWPGRIARGKLTLIAGDPGIGKSQITVDIASRISTSERWPDAGNAKQGNVLLLSAEDSAHDTLRPRMEAAGAELARIHVLKAVTTGGKSTTFSLQTDLDALGRKITELGGADLVIIDPITSYMGSKIDSHRNTDVRAVLEPLAAFAEKHNVAVLGVTHPPKATQSKALHAVTGSLAFVAAARMVFIAVEEPESERRLLLAVKNNLGPLAAGLGFRCVQRLIGDGIIASYVTWDSAPVTTTANEALATTGSNSGAVTEAVEFLREELAAGPRPTHDLKKAAQAAGLSWATIRRAQDRLKIKPAKGGLNEGWVWQLPEGAHATKPNPNSEH
jgi:putative DNA primase/helicase